MNWEVNGAVSGITVKMSSIIFFFIFHVFSASRFGDAAIAVSSHVYIYATTIYTYIYIYSCVYNCCTAA